MKGPPISFKKHFAPKGQFSIVDKKLEMDANRWKPTQESV